MKKMNTLSKLLIAAVLPAIWQPVFAASSSFSSLSNFSYQLFDLNNQDDTAASITFFDGGYSASATVLDGQAVDAGNGNVNATTSTAGSSASASIADTHSTGGRLPSSISVTAASSRFDAAYGNASFLSNFALSANTRVVFFAASSFNNFVTSEFESAQSFAGLYAYSNVQYVFDELANDTLPIYNSVSVWPRHLELIQSSREHRGHDEQGSSGVHGADGDDCSLAAHRYAHRVDWRVVCKYVAAARRRQRPGFSRRASTGGAATPRCGCSTASAVV